MLSWPRRAQAAIRKLFEPLQDIDVYVEDENDEPFYGCLLNFVTDGKIPIARVFGLGGRAAVLQRAVNHDHTLRRALFIVDGDLEWVKGLAAPATIGVHRHSAYCVENLLLCERAVRTIVSHELAITEAEAAQRLDYETWRLGIRAPLIELFAAYATVHDFDSAVATVSTGVGVLCSGGGAPNLDIGKVRAARDAALNAAIEVAGETSVRARYQHVLSRLLSMTDGLHAVSGKDFILPLLGFRLNSLGFKIQRRAMRMRLASGGDPSRFSELVNALRAAANGYL